MGTSSSSSSSKAPRPKRSRRITSFEEKQKQITEKTKQPSSLSSTRSHVSYSQEDDVDCTEVLPCTLEDGIACTEVLPCSPEVDRACTGVRQELSMFQKQYGNFPKCEKDLMQAMIENYVTPQVSKGNKTWDCRIMWMFVRTKYNENAKIYGFENVGRQLEEVYAIAKNIYWCCCHSNSKEECFCVILKIPDCHEPASSLCLPLSSRKRSHESISSVSITERVTDTLNSLADNGYISCTKARDAAVLYSNMINNGLEVAVEMFCRADSVEKKLKHLEVDLSQFGGRF